MFRIIRAAFVIAPIAIVTHTHFYTISKIYLERVRGNRLSPVLNPFYGESSGVLEDDYVLVKRIHHPHKYEELKGKYVLIRNPVDQTKTDIKRVEAVQGQWYGQGGKVNVFVPMGSAMYADQVDEEMLPLALIEGIVLKTVWPRDRAFTEIQLIFR